MKMIVFVVFCFIALDFATGVGQALITKTFSSTKMREGLVHKATELIIIGLAALCEWGLPFMGITVGVPLVTAACTYVTLMELSSILENLGKVSPGMHELVLKLFGEFIDKDHHIKGGN